MYCICILCIMYILVHIHTVIYMYVHTVYSTSTCIIIELLVHSTCIMLYCVLPYTRTYNIIILLLICCTCMYSNSKTACYYLLFVQLHEVHEQYSNRLQEHTLPSTLKLQSLKRHTIRSGSLLIL